MKFFKLDLFVTIELTKFIFRLIGFYSFYYLAYRTIKLKYSASLLMAAIFTLMSSCYKNAIQTQLFTIAFAPLLTIFIFNYLGNLNKREKVRSIIWGSFTGIFYSSWLLTAYYIPFFYTLFATTFLIISYINFSPPVNELKWFIMACCYPLSSYLDFLLIPFLMVYLPTALQTGMHQYVAALHWLPTIKELIFLGDSKFLPHLRTREVCGYPLIFAILSLAAIIYTVYFSKDSLNRYFKPLALAIIISFLFMLKINDHSLWFIIWKFVPGAKGVRVISRYLIVLQFALCLLICYILTQKKIGSVFFTSFIYALMLLEQLNFSGAS